MNTPYDQSFDDLLNGFLTDYQNQVDADGNPIDTSKGSLAFIKSACMASALWGIYKAQDYIADQIFPDTSDSANLEHHVYIRGILPRKPGELDAALLSRLLAYIRRPPAGGNQYDYVQWAVGITGVAAAYSVPLSQGPGTVDVIVVADPVSTGSEIPSADLLTAVKSYIDSVRPVTAKYTRALAVSLLPTDVTVTGTGANFDKAQTIADITAYLNAFIPGQTLFPAALTYMAVTNGADNVTATVPAAPIVPTSSQAIRPGVISVP
jgi:uncharacterized phage protein gp47/JayE